MKYLVLGGGISGLVTSHLLARKFPQSQILLIEKDKRCGGWVDTRKSFSDSGALIDVGPHSARVQANNSNFIFSYLNLLDLNREIRFINYYSKANARFIYAGGKMIPLKFFTFDNYNVFRRSPLSSLIRTILSRPNYKPLADTEDITVDEFFRTRLGDDIADYFASAMIRGIFAGDSREISLKGALPIMAKYDEGNSNFILNYAKNSLSGNIRPAKASPEVFQLLEMDENSVKVPYKSLAWSLNYGMEQFVDRILQKINDLPNVQIVTNCEVKSLKVLDQIKVDNDETYNFEVCYHNTESDGYFSANAHSIFSSLPPFVMNTILSEEVEFSDNAKKFLSTPFASVASCGIELTGPKKYLPKKGFGYLVPAKEDRDILGVIFDSVGFDHMDGFDEKTGHRTSRFTVMMKGDEVKSNYIVSERALEVLRNHLKIDTNMRNRPIAFHPVILRNCIPQYQVGHRTFLHAFISDMNETIAQRQITNGLFHYSGMNSRGVGLVDAIYSGVECLVKEITFRKQIQETEFSNS